MIACNIQLRVGYHCTLGKNPTDHDNNKLKWLMAYTWSTCFLPTVIKITEDGGIIYIDGSHVFHTDTKVYSGMFMTIGKGALLNIAKKLGLLTIS